MTGRRAELARVLARLDALVNLETSPTATISAGRIDGLSLDRMLDLCGLLGDPHRAWPSVHVTGTNGKGTVVRAVSAILAACDLHVGATTSPHLERLNERIERNGEPITDADLADVLDRVLSVGELLGVRPSWFEVVTAAAFTWFADIAVDVAVVEVGLLGRVDATNVIDADVAVITSIDRDHTDSSPGWKADVMGEKAGIVAAGSVCVLGPVDDDLLPLVMAEDPSAIVRVGNDLTVLDDDVAVGGRLVSVATRHGRYDELFVPVHGAHQAVNVALAVSAVDEFFGRAIDRDVVASALESLSFPGRAEVVSREPLVIVDGAHNEAAGVALAATIHESFTTLGSRVLVLGVLAGRDPVSFVRAVADAGFDGVIVTTPPSPRALAASDLAEVLARESIDAEVVADPVDAVRAAVNRLGEDDMVVVTGSFAMVAPARVAVRAARP